MSQQNDDKRLLIEEEKRGLISCDNCEVKKKVKKEVKWSDGIKSGENIKDNDHRTVLVRDLVKKNVLSNGLCEIIEVNSVKEYNNNNFDDSKAPAKNFVKDIIDCSNELKRDYFDTDYDEDFIKKNYHNIIDTIRYNSETKLNNINSFLFITAKERRQNMLISLARQLDDKFHEFKFIKEDFNDTKIEEEKNKKTIKLTNRRKRKQEQNNNNISEEEKQKIIAEEMEKKDKLLQNFFQECKNISKIKWGRANFCSCFCDYDYGINLDK